MSNPSKQKGTAFESAIVNYLHARGLEARRVALSGAHDSGDIRIGDWTLEAKNRKGYALAEALDQARTEAHHAGTKHYAAVIKRNGVGDVARAFVVIDLELFSTLL
jgi:Holliday junction resolvase